MSGFARWLAGHNAKPDTRHHTSMHVHSLLAVLQCSCCCRYGDSGYLSLLPDHGHELQASGDIVKGCHCKWNAFRRCNKWLQLPGHAQCLLHVKILQLPFAKSCTELQNCCAAQFTKLCGYTAAQLRGNVNCVVMEWNSCNQLCMERCCSLCM